MVNKGSYLLVFKLFEGLVLTVGRLGRFHFPAGFYVYVGSALNSLTGRVGRHLKESKVKKWHIDFLLPHAKVLLVILVPSEKRLECEIAKRLNGKIVAKKFGSTDCNCLTHLFYYETFDELLTDLVPLFKYLQSITF